MKNIRKNSPTAWILAARPHTLVASATPVIVACALAFKDGFFNWIPAVICLVFALLAQVVSNFANDYFDYIKGADQKGTRVGPDRAILEGWIDHDKILKACAFLLVLDCLIALPLLYYGGWQLIFVGIFVAIFAIAYSAGPYPLSYNGWGDVCVLVFFGFVPIYFTYYVQALRWTPEVFICAVAVGLVIVNILVANNYRDRDTDKEAEKRTSVVVFGEKFGRYFYLINGIISVLLCQCFWLDNSYLAALLPIIYLIFHLKTWAEMITIYQGPGLIAVLKKSARNAFLFGLLLTLGLLFS